MIIIITFRCEKFKLISLHFVINQVLTMSILQFSRLNSKKVIVSLAALCWVFAIPIVGQVADFDFVISKKCAPSLVSFQNKSTTGGGLKYMWDFGKGSLVFSDEIFLEEVYAESGSYKVVLHVIDGTDTVSTEKTVTLFDGPQARFTVSDSIGCIPITINLDDNSIQGDASLKSYFWDFRNGDTYTSKNLSIDFKDAGDYNIYYRVTDNNGCSSDIESIAKLRLGEGPIVNFSVSESFACSPPLAVKFTNLSIGDGNFTSYWNFGNGITSTNFSDSVTYTSEGKYSVSLEVTDDKGCSNILRRYDYIGVGTNSGQINVISGGQEIENDSALLCPGDLFFISDLPEETSKKWLIDYNGVQQTFVDENVIPLEMPDSGTVFIELSYGEGTACPDTLRRTYFIDWIKADFDFANYYTCSLPVDLLSVENSQNAQNYEWLLPDSSSRVTQNINYTITNDTSHEVIYSHSVNDINYPFQLVVTNANNCADTASKTFNAKLPVARFMPDKTSGCAPLQVTFSDSSKSDESITEWEYLVDGVKVGDSDGTPYQYTFNTAGEYQVQLVIRNNLGCEDTSYVVSVKVGDILSPSLSVAPSLVCPGSSVTLTNSTAPVSGDVQWIYAITDVYHSGNTSDMSVTVPVRSDQSGLHDVVVQAYYNGCVSTVTLTDEVNIYGPTGSFIELMDCATPLEYTFISKLDSTTTISWDIDGSIYDDMDTVNYTFPASGDYAVSITGQHAATGCIVSKTKIIKARSVLAVIEPQPYACLGYPVIFLADNSEDYIDSCYQEGFLWDFDVPEPPRRTYQPFYEFTYNDTGTYHVMLQVEAVNGCIDTAEMDISIEAPFPEFSVDVDSGCAPFLDVTFTYDNLDSEIHHWTWVYDDYQIDTNVNPVQHTYSASGNKNYYPILYATDIYGCMSYRSKVIKMTRPNPEFQAFDSAKCLGEIIAFNHISQTHDSLLIDFGDGTTSNSSMRHEYLSTGTYDVSLTVYENGCEATMVRSQYVVIEGVDATFSVSDSVLDCYPVTIDFEHLGVGDPIDDGFWDFGNGSTSNNYSRTAQYTYTKPGVYITRLNILTENNCIAEASKEIIVNGPFIDFDFSPKLICSGDEVQFVVNDSVNIESFLWVFGDGSTSSEYEPSHQYIAKGIITPAVSVVNDNCEVLLTADTLWVSDVQADFFLEGNEYCLYDPLIAQNYSNNYSDVNWFLNGENISQTDDLVHALTEAGVFKLLLEVTGQGNCTDTTSRPVIVWPVPEFSIDGVTSLCPGEQTTLSVDRSSINWQIEWSPQQAVSNTNNFQVQTNVDATSVIHAEVTNAHDCSTINSVVVYMGELPNLNRVPIYDTSIFIGQSIQFAVSADKEGVVYSWEPNYNISCTNCSNPVVSPVENTNYYLTASDSCSSETLIFPVEVIVDFYLEFPDAFTPNGDGENDFFNYEYDELKEIEFKIYNRWGSLVYSSTTLGEQGWDGTYKGEIQNIDSYTYYVRAISEHGFEFERKGVFTLLK